MMASTAMPVTTTPAGLLTAGEVSSRYAEMRRRVNLFIPTSACLFRAVGDLCASAERGKGIRGAARRDDKIRVGTLATPIKMRLPKSERTCTKTTEVIISRMATLRNKKQTNLKMAVSHVKLHQNGNTECKMAQNLKRNKRNCQACVFKIEMRM